MVESIYKRNRHAVYDLRYHLVAVTKYRHPVLVDDIRKRLLEITDELLEKWNVELLSVETGKDHIHLYFSAPPQVCPAVFINNYKTVTARLIRKEFSEYLKPYYWKPYFWSRSYFVSLASEVSDSAIRRYIEAHGAEQ